MGWRVGVDGIIEVCDLGIVSKLQEGLALVHKEDLHGSNTNDLISGEYLCVGAVALESELGGTGGERSDVELI